MIPSVTNLPTTPTTGAIPEAKECRFQNKRNNIKQHRLSFGQKNIVSGKNAAISNNIAAYLSPPTTPSHSLPPLSQAEKH